jgi:ComEC/Rec2-related protein
MIPLRLIRVVTQLRRDLCCVHPLVYASVALLAGVKYGFSTVAQPRLWLIAFALFSGLLVFTLKCRVAGLRVPLLICLFFAAGALRSSCDVFRSEGDLNFAHDHDQAVEIKCRIKRVLSCKVLKGRAARYRIAVRDVRCMRDSRRFFVPVTVNWYGNAEAMANEEAPATGELWCFKGRIYPSRFTRDGAALIFNSGEHSSRRVQPARFAGFSYRLRALRKDFARRVTIGINEWRDVADINRAVLLGMRENLSPALKRIFVSSGTVHVFAISGLHIALIAAVFAALVSYCGVPLYYWLFAVVPLLAVYTMLTGMRPSALRAALMALLFFCAPFFRRRFSTLTALAGAAIIVHLYCPAFISDIGSILSFSVMLGLATLYQPLNKLFLKAMRVDFLRREVALLRAANERARANLLQSLAQAGIFISGLCAVTIAAWLTALPLSAYFFERIAPGGIVANLVISPCVFMLVVAGVLGFVASFFSATLAAIFNNAAGLFTAIMIRTADSVSNCPGSNFMFRDFPVWLVWLWFATLLSAGWILRRRLEKRADGLEWMGDG